MADEEGFIPLATFVPRQWPEPCAHYVAFMIALDGTEEETGEPVTVERMAPEIVKHLQGWRHVQVSLKALREALGHAGETSALQIFVGPECVFNLEVIP